MKFEYKNHYITILVTHNKTGNQVVYTTVINSKQIYKVSLDSEVKLNEEEIKNAIEKALLECKQQIDMSEELNVQSEEITESTAPVLDNIVDSVMSDPAEDNICDSCQ